ncbi:hypothetical protein [Rheinheimera faecalis]|uniref:hypothetical protein n=1 Tax=Rheinheimera faecalis TaxID=2901141 RepID=UPI001E340277|nr:hypothetical protein [Rheinheimera faecalis]
MRKTRKLLNSNRESFDMYSNFSDYQILIDCIESKVTADNSIEACKALIEGISKTIIDRVDLRCRFILRELDNNQIDNISNAKSQIKNNTIKFVFAFKQASLILSIYHHSFGKSFFDAVGNPFCNMIGEIRNWKGDVSHGRVAPKMEKTSLELASLVESLTDTITFHMLEVFSLIDFSAGLVPDRSTIISESFVDKTETQLTDIPDEERDIRDFNDVLDELYPLPGKPRYSRALYEQYFEDYEIQLKEFLDNKELELSE